MRVKLDELMYTQVVKWEYLKDELERDIFEGWLTGKGVKAEMRKFPFLQVVGMFDHSPAIKIGVQLYEGKRHRGKWSRDPKNYAAVKG
ncbi:hypothetical protein SAY87_008137 [Trapa incisa]|uniref:Uncharacterized protein n=1 Tax=Trapa incisa TaxID=236973 RepID=A0AAN7KNE1_9MYRT|nr:hypothetical protein SAY87_008137 [Trapa incisa]